MKKLFCVIFLVLVFILFLLFINREKAVYEVISVETPTKLVLDFNKNKIKDNNEVFNIKDLYSFSTISENNKDVVKKMGITAEDALRMGYITEKFAKDTLLNKSVKIDNNDIYINGKSYRAMLIKNGFAAKAEKAEMTSIIKTNIDNVKKLNLVILNKKNYIYHKPNCKYGLLAKDIEILPKTQLTKDAKPCNYCHVKPKKKIAELKTYKNLVLKTYSTQLFLTDFTTRLKPDNQCKEDICRLLVNEINSAKESIDFAIYGYTKIPKFEKALTDAQKRGVKIRFVFDTHNDTNIYPDTFYLADKIKNHNSDKERAIMHNKFFVFDNKKVYTGSANISNTDMSGFNSNVVLFINSEEIANLFTQEFEQMYSGRFHEQKQKIQKANNSNVKVYFSPADDIIATEIIPLINQAKKYIYIPAFLITHDKFSQSLILAHKKGVDVKIILDSTNTKEPSKIKILRESGIPVKTENYAGKLHSKSIIIDDRYLVVGSMNFSSSGAKRNDENLILLTDENMTKFYRDFFLYLWKKIPDKWLKYNANAESPDSIGSCSDGIDNDYDGDIDLNDSGCKVKQLAEKIKK